MILLDNRNIAIIGLGYVGTNLIDLEHTVRLL
jgi:UDP-N-acetyl-D-mannosaminuronate dehydrogenase